MHVYISYVGISIHGCMWSILFRSYVANKIIIYFLFIECSCWFIITIMVQFYHRPRRPRRAPDNQRTYQIKCITDNMIQLIFWWMVYAIINCQFRTLSIGNISHPNTANSTVTLILLFLAVEWEQWAVRDWIVWHSGEHALWTFHKDTRMWISKDPFRD